MRGSRTAGRCRVSVVDEIRCGSGGRGIGVVVVSGMFTGDEKEEGTTTAVESRMGATLAWRATAPFLELRAVSSASLKLLEKSGAVSFFFLGGFFMVTFMNSEFQTTTKKRGEENAEVYRGGRFVYLRIISLYTRRVGSRRKDERRSLPSFTMSLHFETPLPNKMFTVTNCCVFVVVFCFAGVYFSCPERVCRTSKSDAISQLSKINIVGARAVERLSSSL